MCKDSSNLGSQKEVKAIKKKRTLTIDFLVKAFLLIACAVAFFVLIFILFNFYVSQAAFTKSFTSAVSSLTSENDTLRMEYLRRIAEMHRQASNLDLFVFLYGFLSSVLIGVSVFMVNKTSGSHKDLEKNQNSMIEQHNELDRRINALSNQAGNIEKGLEEKSNYFRFSFISQILSDSLSFILCYSMDEKRNGFIVRFRESVYQVSEWCGTVDFAKIDSICVEKFGQRLGYVKSIYFEVVEDAKGKTRPEYLKHRSDMDAHFSKIERSLANANPLSTTAVSLTSPLTI
jgi:hypothetical protein